MVHILLPGTGWKPVVQGPAGTPVLPSKAGAGKLALFKARKQAIYDAFEQVWANDGEDDEDGGGDAQDGAD